MTYFKKFKFTGYPQRWVCPAGITGIGVTVVGGMGGGFGLSGVGRVDATLTTTPGNEYWFYVGGRGGNGLVVNEDPGGAAGWNGGGHGGGVQNSPELGYCSGYGGGGASDIRSGGQALSNRVVVGAGSGGDVGNSITVGGVGGGTTGGAGGGTYGGGGGTSSAGGAYIGTGGTVTGGGINYGTAGALGQGGAGGFNTFQNGGGGGGGGYYGGGGGGLASGSGANGSSGGGGSNYVGGVSGVTNTQNYNNQANIDGWIEISYPITPPTPTLQRPVNNARVLQAATYLFGWIFNDFAEDSHNSSNFRYRALGSSTWITTTNANTNTAAVSGAYLTYTLTATLTAGQEYEWQAQCKDSSGLTGAWSDSFYFVPVVNPVLAPGLPTGGIELEVYDGLTGAFISNVPGRINPTFTDEMGNCGGSLTLLMTDPTWVTYSSLVKYQNIVRVKIAGKYVGFWLMMKKSPTLISSNENADIAMVISGPGAYGVWFDNAVFYPENDSNAAQGTQLVGTGGGSPKTRMFGFGSSKSLGNWYESYVWLDPIPQSQWADVTTWSPSGFPLGNPWGDAPTDWPDNQAFWVAWQETRSTAGTDPVGNTYFRKEFYLTTPMNVFVYVAADNACIAYMDGEKVTDGSDWTHTSKSQPISLGTGPHTLAIQLTQYPAPVGQLNPSGMIAAVYQIGDATAGTVDTLLFDTSSDPTIGYNGWQIQGHPSPVPGWAVGDLLNTIINEAIARGVSAYSLFTLGFTYLADSYGFKWAKDGRQYIVNIGDSYKSLVDKMDTSGVDIWFDANLKLQAAPQRGLDRSVLYPGDTYLTMIKRATPLMAFLLTAAPVSGVGGPSNNGWHDDLGGAKILFLAGVPTSGFTYATAFPSPAVILGARSNGGTGGTSPEMTLNDTDGPAVGGEWAFEFWDETADGSFKIIQLGSTGAGCIINFGINEWPGVSSNDVLNIMSLQISIKNTGTGITVATAKAQIKSDNNGSHFVINFKDNGVIGSIQLYKNTQLLIDMTFPSGTKPTRLPMDVQGDNFGSTGFFGGYVWYGRNLTQDEIRNHYRGGIGLYNPVQQPVIFSVGRNVITASSDLEFQTKTTLVVAADTQTYEFQTSSANLATYGRIEGYYDASQETVSDSKVIADVTLTALISQSTGATAEVYGDYTPWRDFGVGDWVLAPPDQGVPAQASYVPVRRRVMSISATEDKPTRRVIYAIEFDTIEQQAADRLTKWLNRALPQGDLGGTIPSN